ncbi:hypothetical protein [Leptolyngbya sp. AN03gr2]|uniref:hypothetical protein n=1 Tax=Leptolyngbya sp. AN03gr2 TaxID=3423364 RepID=UPI003D3101E8
MNHNLATFGILTAACSYAETELPKPLILVNFGASPLFLSATCTRSQFSHLLKLGNSSACSVVDRESASKRTASNAPRSSDDNKTNPPTTLFNTRGQIASWNSRSLSYLLTS